MSKDEEKGAPQIEAEGVTEVTVDHAGEDYQLPASSDDWPFTVTYSVEDGKFAHAVEALLGAKQWTRFSATAPTNATALDFFKRYAEKIGLDLPG